MDAAFSFVRLPVLARLVLISLTFVLSVIGGFATFGGQQLSNKLTANFLQDKADRQKRVSSSAGVEILPPALLQQKEACQKADRMAEAEAKGGLGKPGAGPKYRYLLGISRDICSKYENALSVHHQAQVDQRGMVDKYELAAKQLLETGEVSDPEVKKALEQDSEHKKIAGATYAARFAQAAEEASKTQLFIRPWASEDWKQIKSPAQVIHFFYLLFFVGMLMVKLFQNVSVAAYFSEELQNAWNDPEVQHRSGISPNDKSYVYNFAQWFYFNYYHEKLVDDYSEATDLNQVRDCRDKIERAERRNAGAEAARLDNTAVTLQASISQLDHKLEDVAKQLGEAKTDGEISAISRRQAQLIEEQQSEQKRLLETQRQRTELDELLTALLAARARLADMKSRHAETNAKIKDLDERYKERKEFELMTLAHKNERVRAEADLRAQLAEVDRELAAIHAKFGTIQDKTPRDALLRQQESKKAEQQRLNNEIDKVAEDVRRIEYQIKKAVTDQEEIQRQKMVFERNRQTMSSAIDMMSYYKL